MKHTSVLKLNSPIEFIESTQISPFISKVLIKVCYVGDEPNRNGSIITKETATQMAPSLRGCPIVGFFNETKGDFEEHNQQITIANGEWRISDSTNAYGFVDLNAKIWFATYIDDNKVEREYLCTEGYIWTKEFPEAERILSAGNNHSMKLADESLDGSWTKDENNNPQFFIINEAFIQNLCILGEDVEPCFEGSQITKFSLVVDESFQNKLFSMITELKEILQEGGTKVFTQYAVEIGDSLWCTLYEYLRATYPNENDGYCSMYRVEGIYEEDGQKFAILAFDNKYYRLDFSLTEEEGFAAAGELIEVTKTFTPSDQPQFAAEKVEEFIAQYKESNKEEEQTEIEEEEESQEEEKKYSYNSLEEIAEYSALLDECQVLKNQVNEMTAQVEALNNELTSLRNFKLAVERKEKEAMINSFYMLSDEDKADVINNIDTYSLDDIEAKLSIICVRNKVTFTEDKEPVKATFNLDSEQMEDNLTPAWVKAAMNVAKTLDK